MNDLGLGQRLLKHIDPLKVNGVCVEHPQPTVMYHCGGCALRTMISHSPCRDYLQETDCGTVYASMETYNKTCVTWYKFHLTETNN